MAGQTFSQMMASTPMATAELDAAPVQTFDDVYREHVAFVWRVLRGLGVAPAQLEDAAQDVFVIVHRRLASFEGRAAITTWLFAISRRIASRYRRKQKPKDPPPSEWVAPADPFAEASRGEAAAIIEAAMGRMDDDKRIVFSLVELEQVPVAEVARLLDLNVNTAYSRLRLARAELVDYVRSTSKGAR
jgi:RNA polymerase sigma-70 factor (ECF subfamily)